MKTFAKALILALFGLALAGCIPKLAGTAADPMAAAEQGTPEHDTFCKNRLEQKDTLTFFSRIFDAGTSVLGVVDGGITAATAGAVKLGVGEALDNTSTAYYSTKCKDVWDRLRPPPVAPAAAPAPKEE